jgi:hypothetical protein
MKLWLLFGYVLVTAGRGDRMQGQDTGYSVGIQDLVLELSDTGITVSCILSPVSCSAPWLRDSLYGSNESITSAMVGLNEA